MTAPRHESREKLLDRAAARTIKGEQAAALRTYRTLVDRYPNDVDVLVPATRLFRGCGMANIAVQLLGPLARQPEAPIEVLTEYGLALAACGRTPAAVQTLLNAAAAAPQRAEPLVALGDVARGARRPDHALTQYQLAIERDPDSWRAWLGIARCHLEMDNPEAGDALARAVKSAGRTSAEPLLALGALAMREGVLDAAEALLLRASADPRCNTTAVAALAECARAGGDWSQAAELLNPLLALDPPSVDAVMAFARIAHKVDRVDEAIRHLQRVVDSPRSSTMTRSAALTEIGVLQERRGNFVEAFYATRRSHEAAKVPYDADAFDRSIQELIDAFPTDVRLNLSPEAREFQRPIFIVGMPRSGTTLVEQILSAHPQVHGGGELTWVPELIDELDRLTNGRPSYPALLKTLPPAALEAAAGRLRERFARTAPEQTFVTDKLPHNFLHVGLISLLLPGARVIHCLRDPLDTCLSCYMTPLSIRHAYRFRFDTLGRQYQAYRRIMDHWIRVLDLPILTIAYENLVADQQAETQRLLEFIGLPWEDDCLAFHESERLALTASQDQVRRPMYKSSVGRADRYGPLLDELREALGPYGRPRPEDGAAQERS